MKQDIVVFQICWVTGLLLLKGLHVHFNDERAPQEKAKIAPGSLRARYVDGQRSMPKSVHIECVTSMPHACRDSWPRYNQSGQLPRLPNWNRLVPAGCQGGKACTMPNLAQCRMMASLAKC